MSGRVGELGGGGDGQGDGGVGGSQASNATGNTVLFQSTEEALPAEVWRCQQQQQQASYSRSLASFLPLLLPPRTQLVRRCHSETCSRIPAETPSTHIRLHICLGAHVGRRSRSRSSETGELSELWLSDWIKLRFPRQKGNRVHLGSNTDGWVPPAAATSTRSCLEK